MRKKIKLSLLFFCTLFLNAQSFSQISFEDALTKAKTEDKRVIVDIYTDWCGWCQKLDKESYGSKEIKEIIEEDFILVKLNAESSAKVKYKGKDYSEESLAVYFQATGYPTTVFLEPNGDVIEYFYDKFKMRNLPGYFPKKEFKKILEYFRDEKYLDTDLSKII